MKSSSFPALSIIYEVLSVFEARDEVYFCVSKGIDKLDWNFWNTLASSDEVDFYVVLENSRCIHQFKTILRQILADSLFIFVTNICISMNA